MSDDEEDDNEVQVIKSEPMDTASTSFNNLADQSQDELIDLTEEALDESEVTHHHIPWLAELIRKAKNKAKCIDQQDGTSNDVIVIDEPDEQMNLKSSIESHKNVSDSANSLSIQSQPILCFICHRKRRRML